MKNEIIEWHVIVKGQVQGVFFRGTTKELAQKLGICGTVKNLKDGSVEIIAQGNEETFNQLIRLLKDKFSIQSIDQTINKPKINLIDFKIVY